MARLLPVGIFVCLLRETLEADPLYSDLWLEGEVSDLSRSAAGHTYFSLRDDDGSLKCVLFRGQALRQHQLPRIGDNIAVHGGLSIYPRSGSIQLVADLVRPAGLGPALLELEYLRQRLDSEGLFDPERKRELPSWPNRIGVITSEHGAAWHDIQQVVARRFPLATLVLAPALVQGLGAAESIVDAIEAIQLDATIDVVILARGGGASDDLAAFNDERVARAVFACRVPVVAGIGHATDRTVVEDVADAYAATPSAAAEICVPSAVELKQRVRSLESRLIWAYAAAQNGAEFAAMSAMRRLAAQSPRKALDDYAEDVNRASDRLSLATHATLAHGGRNLRSANTLLKTLDPSSVLRRGYAALRKPGCSGAIFSVSQIDDNSQIEVIMGDGSLSATVDGISAVPSMAGNV
jgi:exodeoxyribonuclease VII large subunit